MIKKTTIRCRYCNKILNNAIDGLMHICNGKKAKWDYPMNFRRNVLFKNEKTKIRY